MATKAHQTNTAVNPDAAGVPESLHREAWALLRLRISDLESRCSRGRKRLRPFWLLGLYAMAGLAVGALAALALPTKTFEALRAIGLARLGGVGGLVVGACIEFWGFIGAWRQVALLTRLRQQLDLAEGGP